MSVPRPPYQELSRRLHEASKTAPGNTDPVISVAMALCYVGTSIERLIVVVALAASIQETDTDES